MQRAPALRRSGHAADVLNVDDHEGVPGVGGGAEVVLLDIQLPDLDVLAVAERLASGSDPPIVVSVTRVTGGAGWRGAECSLHGKGETLITGGWLWHPRTLNSEGTATQGGFIQAASGLDWAKLVPSARAEALAAARPGPASLVTRLGWKRTSLTSSIPAQRSQSLK